MIADFLNDVGIAQYWALLMAATALVFALRRGLFGELRRRHWLIDPANRFTLGAIILVIAVIGNAASWGASVTATHFDLPTADMAFAIAKEMRPWVRLAGIVGIVTMLSSVTDSRREWLGAVLIFALVFAATLMLVAA